jgi:hypothetical protein
MKKRRKELEARFMTKPNYVAVLAILNAMLRRVSTSLPEINRATRGLLRDEIPPVVGMSANGLGKASA